MLPSISANDGAGLMFFILSLSPSAVLGSIRRADRGNQRYGVATTDKGLP